MGVPSTIGAISGSGGSPCPPDVADASTDGAHRVRVVNRKPEATSKYIHPSQLLSFVGGESPWTFDPAAYFAGDGASL